MAPEAKNLRAALHKELPACHTVIGGGVVITGVSHRGEDRVYASCSSFARRPQQRLSGNINTQVLLPSESRGSYSEAAASSVTTEEGVLCRIRQLVIGYK